MVVEGVQAGGQVLRLRAGGHPRIGFEFRVEGCKVDRFSGLTVFRVYRSALGLLRFFGGARVRRFGVEGPEVICWKVHV